MYAYRENNKANVENDEQVTYTGEEHKFEIISKQKVEKIKYQLSGG